MSGEGGEWLNLAAALAFFVWLGWLSFRKRGKLVGDVAKDRPQQPYSVFTRQFDVVTSARQVRSMVSAVGSVAIPRDTSLARTEDRIAAAEVEFRRLLESPERGQWQTCLGGRDGKAAIVVLFDQSGSMSNRIVPFAGQVRFLFDELESAGIRSALLGFTTLGWRGGGARTAWTSTKRKAYPGRLCALLHIIYKPFDAALAAEDWRPMLDANCLFENIDGEAIEWAASLLNDCPEPDKRLIIVSDGVPMDDSTVQENGFQFLPRHRDEVVSRLHRAGNLKIGNLMLDDYGCESFRFAKACPAPEEFMAAFCDLMAQMDATVA